jgi:hypothetical protein
MTYILLIGIQINFIFFSDNYYKFWDSYNYIVNFPLKPIKNTYKFGIVGFSLSSFKILEKIKGNKKIFLLFILSFPSQFLYNNNYIKEIDKLYL